MSLFVPYFLGPDLVEQLGDYQLLKSLSPWKKVSRLTAKVIWKLKLFLSFPFLPTILQEAEGYSCNYYIARLLLWVVMATGCQRFGVHVLPVHDEVLYCILKDSAAGLLYSKRLKVAVGHQNVSFEDSPSLLNFIFSPCSHFTCHELSTPLPRE
jgi:hypothetical protein